MHSVRAFFGVWSFATVIILGYAFADLAIHPQLRLETNFTMQPDIRRVGELVHWGGRLLKEGHWSLLVANALVLGGVAALALGALLRALRRDSGGPVEAEARISLP